MLPNVQWSEKIRGSFVRTRWSPCDGGLRGAMFYLPGCVAADAITPGCGPPTPELNAEGKLFLYKLQLAWEQRQIPVCNKSGPAGAIDHGGRMLL